MSHSPGQAIRAFCERRIRRMPLLARLTDVLVLRPSRHPIETSGKQRQLLHFRGGHLEAWSHEVGSGDAPDYYVLKFHGTGGRAERSTNHPAEYWPDVTARIWAVNMPGYGGSSGRATLQVIPEAAMTAYEAVRREAGDRPLLVTGNSLGTLSALMVAARCRVDGLILRNPPPLRELIVGCYGWWNLTLGARAVASQVPRELDPLRNAGRSSTPAVFISSQLDRTVPPRFHRLVIDAYAGDKRVLHLADADHATPLEEHEEQQYRQLLAWLREQGNW